MTGLSAGEECRTRGQWRRIPEHPRIRAQSPRPAEPGAWDYIVGARDRDTMRRNRMALDEIAFRPRVPRNVARVDASTEVFGRKLRLPVMTPVARSRSSIRAAAAVARGAGQFGAAHMSVRCPSPGLKRRQRQRPTRCASTVLCPRVTMLLSSAVNRAVANGYAAFCLTVDTAHYSRRERDIAKRYVRESRIRATGGDFRRA